MHLHEDSKVKIVLQCDPRNLPHYGHVYRILASTEKSFFVLLCEDFVP